MAAAAPFEAVSDGPDRVWVVDNGSGELTLCRMYAAPGPKVIDVFGGAGTVREAAQRSAEPYCEVVRGAGGYGGATPRQNYTGYAMYAPMEGVSTGYYPNGSLAGLAAIVRRLSVQFRALGGRRAAPWWWSGRTT